MLLPRLLTKDEFLACFAQPMRDVTEDAEVAADIWPYVSAVKPLLGSASKVLDVAHVHRDADERFDQVLIGTDQENVFLVIIVDRTERGIFGHHLLDLKAEYSLS